MVYKLTFEDGSDGYLSHHGVLGMHWGIRNSETERKYSCGQDHSTARTDISRPTTGHKYEGKFKPTLSEKQVKMLKRAAAGVAIGAGLAAGIAVGRKAPAIKAAAKYGLQQLSDTKAVRAKGKAFVERTKASAKSKVKSTKAYKKADRFDMLAQYYTRDPIGKKKASKHFRRLVTGAALASVPFVEGHDLKKRELRRKNGRHASAKWIRSKERSR